MSGKTAGNVWIPCYSLLSRFVFNPIDEAKSLPDRLVVNSTRFLFAPALKEKKAQLIKRAAFPSYMIPFHPSGELFCSRFRQGFLNVFQRLNGT